MNDKLGEGKKRPLLYGQNIQTINDLKPFFDQLAIYSYEGIFSLQEADISACEQDILTDVFK